MNYRICQYFISVSIIFYIQFHKVANSFELHNCSEMFIPLLLCPIVTNYNKMLFESFDNFYGSLWTLVIIGVNVKILYYIIII